VFFIKCYNSREPSSTIPSLKKYQNESYILKSQNNFPLLVEVCLTHYIQVFTSSCSLVDYACRLLLDVSFCQTRASVGRNHASTGTSRRVVLLTILLDFHLSGETRFHQPSSPSLIEPLRLGWGLVPRGRPRASLGLDTI
jgi:hypothetical protein